MLGCTDGCVEGCIEGHEIGWPEGRLSGCVLGCIDGCLEGREIGCKEGWPEGCSTGCDEGCRDGCPEGCDGRLDGCVDGWLVGEKSNILRTFLFPLSAKYTEPTESTNIIRGVFIVAAVGAPPSPFALSEAEVAPVPAMVVMMLVPTVTFLIL